MFSPLCRPHLAVFLPDASVSKGHRPSHPDLLYAILFLALAAALHLSFSTLPPVPASLAVKIIMAISQIKGKMANKT